MSAGRATADNQSFAGVSKVHNYIQITRLDGSNGIIEDTVNGVWAFQCQIDGNSTDADTKSFTDPNSKAQILTYDSNNQDWEFNSPVSSSQAALDASFPAGSYTLALRGKTVPVSLSGNIYPNGPLVTANTGTWRIVSGNSFLLIASTQAVTLTLSYTANYEVDPGNWTGRIVNPKSVERSPCQKNDASTVQN